MQLIMMNVIVFEKRWCLSEYILDQQSDRIFLLENEEDRQDEEVWRILRNYWTVVLRSQCWLVAVCILNCSDEISIQRQ
jgi:NAD-dependent dihydropyrimidine dehydrogenase PreA subunit